MFRDVPRLARSSPARHGDCGMPHQEPVRRCEHGLQRTGELSAAAQMAVEQRPRQISVELRLAME